MAANNKIVLRHEDFALDEDGAVTGGASDVTPGYLVERVNEGATDEYQAHSTDAEESPATRFARKTGEIGGEISDAIAEGEILKVARALPGVRINAMLGNGDTVAYGDKLVSNGDGTLRALDTAGGDTDGAVVARAREAADASGGNVRVTVEVV